MMDEETGTLVTERWAARWNRGTAVMSSVQGSVGLVFPSRSSEDQRLRWKGHAPQVQEKD